MMSSSTYDVTTIPPHFHNSHNNYLAFAPHLDIDKVISFTFHDENFSFASSSAKLLNKNLRAFGTCACDVRVFITKILFINYWRVTFLDWNVNERKRTSERQEEDAFVCLEQIWRNNWRLKTSTTVKGYSFASLLLRFLTISNYELLFAMKLLAISNCFSFSSRASGRCIIQKHSSRAARRNNNCQKEMGCEYLFFCSTTLRKLS